MLSRLRTHHVVLTICHICHRIIPQQWLHLVALLHRWLQRPPATAPGIGSLPHRCRHRPDTVRHPWGIRSWTIDEPKKKWLLELLFGLLIVNDQLGDVPRKSSLDVPSMRMTPRCSSGSVSVVICRREAQSRNRGVNEAQATWRELEKDIIHKFTTYNPWFKQNLVPTSIALEGLRVKRFCNKQRMKQRKLLPFKSF